MVSSFSDARKLNFLVESLTNLFDYSCSHLAGPYLSVMSQPRVNTCKLKILITLSHYKVSFQAKKKVVKPMD